MTTSIQLLLCVQANICRAREDPSVFPRQPRSAADGGSGRRTMSHFAHGSGAARAAGEAGRRLLGPSSFPTTCRREPGLRLPAAVLSLCSSDCDVARRRWEEKKKNPQHTYTHTTPKSGLATPQDFVAVWLTSVIGKNHCPVVPPSPPPPRPPAIRAQGGCGRAGALRPGGWLASAGGGAGRGARGAAPRLLPFLSPGEAECGASLHRHLLLTECRKLLTIVRLPGASQTWAD